MLVIPKVQPERYLPTAVLGLVCLTFLNMLYCTIAYEFGYGPMTFLAGPNDRFADVIKLSLSYRSVTENIDQSRSFRSWKPIYQRYYEHPDYGGVASLAAGDLTHFHHPPLSTLLFLMTGIFIVQSGSPTLTLLLCFLLYLLEVWMMIWIGIPRGKRTPELTTTILFLCLASYPALVMFGRANYVNAGFTTIPIVIFLLAVFARGEAKLASLTALAIATNIHPNAILMLVALPAAFGRKAFKPILQFLAISSTIFVVSYFAAHQLYPDYTLLNFRKGLTIYEKVYIENGAGIRMGSSLYGLIRALNHGLHLGISFPTEMRFFYFAAILMSVIACSALWRARIRRERSDEQGGSAEQKGKQCGRGWADHWPVPLVPFFLVSFYCILSPIFADYHLLVFLAPLILAYFERDSSGHRRRSLSLVALASVLLLAPKNYPLRGASIQIVLNPMLLCGAVFCLSIMLLKERIESTHAAPQLSTVEGR